MGLISLLMNVLEKIYEWSYEFSWCYDSV